MTKVTKRRIEWIDIAKALGIFLIVLGHTLRAGKVHLIVYTFSVPLFFIISGLVFKKHKQILLNYLTMYRLIVERIAYGY